MPTPKQTYIEKQTADCQNLWFKSHIAQCGATGDIFKIVWGNALLIKWRNPESWNYGCHFIIHARWLIVVGDIGEAVFEWSEDISLNFLASLDFGYFHSKCQASDKGRDFTQWNGDLCVPRLKEFLNDDPRDDKTPLIEDAENYTSSEQEWCDFLYNSGNELNDDDYSLADAGEEPSTHAIGMFVGLQMAIAQLREQPQNKV